MQPAETFGDGELNEHVDTGELVGNIGLDDAEISWRKEFIGFGPEDERRLADLEPMLKEHQEEIAESFYDNLTAYSQTLDVIGRSPKGVEALKQTQRAYLVSLATGDYDESYFRNRARIGKLHELLDMPLKHYIGQYGVYYDLILDHMNKRVQRQVVEAVEEWAEEADDDGGLGRLTGALGLGGGDTDGLDESFETTLRSAIDDGMLDVLALLRIINLDMQVAADTYVDSYASRLERETERRKRLAGEVEQDVQGPLGELVDTNREVATSAERISQLTEEQHEELALVADELGEASVDVEEIANVTDTVEDRSQETKTLAEDGTDAADSALESLAAIEDSMAELEAATVDLEDRVRDIESVVESINGLAQRTKLLATNASTEASRTGSDDQALELIAQEVSAFSDEARSELSEIETALLDISTVTEETVDAIDETAELLEDGVTDVEMVASHLADIHQAATATAAGMDDVAGATDRQAERVAAIAERVDEAVEDADLIANEVEGVAAASQQQVASTETIAESVERLTDDEDELDEEPIYEQVAQTA